MKSVDTITVIKISGAFIAFLIGSGFATGQEAMQFFVVNGLKGLLGGLITLVFFVYLCLTLMRTGKKHGFKKNEEVFKYYCGNIVGAFLTWYTMIFIIAIHAIMLSGAGVTLHQYYGLPVYLGSGAIALLSMVTLLLGLNRIVDVIGGIGPVIIAMTIFIAVATLINKSSGIYEGAKIIPTLELLKASPHWALSAVLYVGLSALGLASFLPAVGTTIKKDKEIVCAAMLGPVFFSGGLIVVSLALISNIVAVNGQMIPIMVLASQVLPIYGEIFAIIIFLGIYSTATPLLWTVCARFSEEKTRKYKILVITLTSVGFFGGMVLPFDKLINRIYPTFGYAGMVFLTFAIAKDVGIFCKTNRWIHSNPLKYL